MAEKPPLKTLQQCRTSNNPKKTPLLSDIFMQENLQKWPIKVNFAGWRKPHQSWANWVEKLSLKYAIIWESTGICDGILSSLHNINPNPEIVLALSEYWCTKTNTFMFPWGEATITLEDIYVLFGLPILGETVIKPLIDDSSKNMERKLQQVKNAMSISDCETDAWINYFSDNNGEIEHVGFLAFWLSMFVLPDISDRTVESHVFPVAVQLARGVKVALAPAVLAGLYQSLTFVTKHAADFDSAKKVVCVPGPFQIVLLWALERFPWLGSNLARPLRLGQPRIARWDDVGVKASLVEVRKKLRSSGDGFCWRPYASKLENWRLKPFNLDVEKISDGISDDVGDELKSFCVCLQPQELVGIDCTASYRPQRVRKQFGCDKKVQVENAFLSPLDSGNVRLVEDEKSCLPDHDNLWRESVSAHRDEISEGIEQEKNQDDHNKQLLNLSKESRSVHGNEISEGIDEQEKNHDDHKKLLLTSDTVKTESNADEAYASPESEVLDVRGIDNVTKQSLHQEDEEEEEQQSSEGVVILDSDDEVNVKSECKDAIQSRSGTKRLRRRIGDSPDCPLYIFECSRKAVKKSGLSLASAIDVEDY